MQRCEGGRVNISQGDVVGPDQTVEGHVGAVTVRREFQRVGNSFQSGLQVRQVFVVVEVESSCFFQRCEGVHRLQSSVGDVDGVGALQTSGEGPDGW